MDQLKKKAMALSQRAVERLMADEKTAMKIAAAIGKVQQGKTALEKGQQVVLHQLSFASRADLKGVGRRLSVLKRRLRELDEKLSRL